MADFSHLKLDSAELSRALSSLSGSLVKKATAISVDIRRAAAAAEKVEPTAVAFDLATQYRELRVLGGLLQQPPERRASLLSMDGRLDAEGVRTVLELVGEMDRAPILVDALAWTMPPWFVRRSPANAESTRPTLMVFLYAAPDRALATELETQLAPLEEHEKILERWSERQIRPGQDRQRELAAHLAGADFVVAILSADFLASAENMAAAEVAAEKGRLIPVVARPCLWETIPFLGGLEALPSDRRPITLWKNRESAWFEVVNKLREAVLLLRKAGSASGAEQSGSSGRVRGQPSRPNAYRHAPTLDAETAGLEDTTLFSWIHLSDLHFGHGDMAYSWDQVLVLQTLRNDVQALLGRGLPPVDSSLVTGDIAFSGDTRPRSGQTKSTEYDDARRYLQTLAKEVGLTERDVFVVPGNHDVQRSADGTRMVKRLVTALRDGAESIDETLADESDRALLAQRQANYSNFAASFAPACLSPTGSAKLYWHHTFEQNGLRVRLVGLNTALLSSDGGDHGKLRLGMGQLGEALAETSADPGALVVCLSHHPFRGGWLADEREADAWMRNHAHLHLSGHVHDADTEQARTGAGSLFVRVSAGATHAEQTPGGVPLAHSYNFGSIGKSADGSLMVRIWPRRWATRNKAFRADVDILPDGKEFAEHALRLTLKNGRTAS